MPSCARHACTHAREIGFKKVAKGQEELFEVEEYTHYLTVMMFPQMLAYIKLCSSICALHYMPSV